MNSQLGFLANVTVQTAFHPLTYTKVLMQLGYEPRPPRLGKSLFGNPVMVSANIVEYIGDITKRDGVMGLYRGLSFRITGSFVASTAQAHVLSLMRRESGPAKTPEDDEGAGDIRYDEETGEELITWDDMMALLQDTKKDVCAKAVAVMVSQPFHVIATRMMAQYIGRESLYDCYTCGFREIYESEGWRGFFAGLIPRLLCEASCICLTNVITFLLEKIVIEDKDLRKLNKPLVSVFVGSFMYPLQVVANVMSVNSSQLMAGQPPHTPIYSNWVACYWDLQQKKMLKRGASMFWRHQAIRMS